jgi:hypothetical protein
MQQVEIGRIAIHSLWRRKRTGRLVQVQNFARDQHSLQEQVLFADEQGNLSFLTVHSFFLRFTPALDADLVGRETTEETTTRMSGLRPAPALHSGPGY